MSDINDYRKTVPVMLGELDLVAASLEADTGDDGQTVDAAAAAIRSWMERAPLAELGATEREGLYEKMWMDFVSLQLGDVQLLAKDAARYRAVKRCDWISLRIKGQEFIGVSNLDAWADVQLSQLPHSKP